MTIRSKKCGFDGTVFSRHPAVQRKLRIVAFAILTPAFFIRAGFNVSLRDVYLSLIPLAGFLAVKLSAKGIGVYPFARRFVPQDATLTTLLMSTGLTFGTISSTYGLSAGIINRSQFSILVTVVLLSAVVPTFVAQRWFQPQGFPGPSRRDAHQLRRAGALRPDHRGAQGQLSSQEVPPWQRLNPRHPIFSLSRPGNKIEEGPSLLV